jgi:hypothetical protein
LSGFDLCLAQRKPKEKSAQTEVCATKTGTQRQLKRTTEDRDSIIEEKVDEDLSRWHWRDG